MIAEKEFFHSPVLNDLAEFKTQSDIIVANRITKELDDVLNKVFSRDLFGQD